MPNLSALAPITTAATALSNLVLVTPQATQGYQPQNKPNADGTPSTAQQPPSILFHYEGEQTIALKSDITDHYVEDNSAIQDQIALTPERVTTNGFIGELNDVVPGFLKPVKFVADKLTTVTAYEPQLSTTALLAYSEAFFAYQVAANIANSAVSAWSSISDLISTEDSTVGGFGSGVYRSSGIQNKQQIAFQQFYGYWRSRTLFTVQTPWAIFDNMAIEELSPVQDDVDRLSTNFKCTFKKIRTASTLTEIGTSSIPVSLQGRLNSQGSSETDLGTSTPVPGESLGSGLSSMGLA